MAVKGARRAPAPDWDVIVVAAGFAGLYALYRLRNPAGYRGFRLGAAGVG